MTSATNKPGRTRPLDRDGDGKDGGSLKGNQTAPMADAAAEQTGARVIDDEAWAKLQERLTPAAEGAEATGPTLRDTGVLATEIHQLLGAASSPAEVLEAYPQLEEDDLVAAIEWAARQGDPNQPDAGPANSETQPPAEDPLEGADDDTRAAIEQQARPVSDDHRHEPRHDEHLADPAAPAAEAFREQLDQAEASDTFTAEEIAAGGTPVVEQEGEAVSTAADNIRKVADQLRTIEHDDPRLPAVAVNVENLRRLTDNKRLYRFTEGYSASPAGPYLDESEVDVWINAGLAEFSPSAGNNGGVHATDKARRAMREGAFA